MAVSGALRAGRGGSEPCAQRSAGGWAAVRPSTGSGWLWGVGSLVNKKTRRNRLRDPALQSPRAFLWQMKTGAETLSHSRPVKTSEEVLLYASQSIRPRPRVKRSAKVSEETAGFSLGRQAPSP